MTEAVETLHFEAETRKILELVVNSLYSDRKVFLRELISNASDALDRARYESLHNQDLRPADGEASIRILTDEAAGTLTVQDNGIGMTRDEAIRNLGTIARSGTMGFKEAAEGGSIDSLIGQFGVGFYSAFMAADRVVVESLSAQPGSEAVRWSAAAGDEYTVEVGSRAARGTDVILHLKENAKKFLQADRIKDIVRRWSDFIDFPIQVGGEQVNRSVALWTRNPQEVTTEEYAEFYKHITSDQEDPDLHNHFSSDGPLQFHAIFFIPRNRPQDLDFPDRYRGVRLYCRRVMVDEDAKELLPRYLRFVRGVVESPDLDLNVSREMLQKTPTVRNLRKQLAKRVLRQLTELATEDPTHYDAFYERFGRTLKEGVHEDERMRDRLKDLLRYKSTKGSGLRSFKQVVDEMPEGQEHIWYLTGLDLERLERSPLLEKFRRKGWEVLLMPDAVDEWVVMHLREYGGKTMKSVAKGDIEDKEEKDDPKAQDDRKASEPLLAYLKELFQADVQDVRVSGRLTDSPSVLVDAEWGLGSNMERILRVAQQSVPQTSRVLEINADHALIRNMGRMLDQGRKANLEPLAWLLLDHARLAEGDIPDPSQLVQRLQRVMLQASVPIVTLPHPTASEGPVVIDPGEVIEG